MPLAASIAAARRAAIVARVSFCSAVTA